MGYSGSKYKAPDYTVQDATLFQDTAQKNEKQAGGWNDYAKSWNHKTNSLYGKSTGFADRIGGLSIVDLWDDPDTEKNENPFSRLLERGQNLDQRWDGITTNKKAPKLTGTVQGMGSTKELDLPNLVGLKTGRYDKGNSAIDDALAALEKLQQDRLAEEKRISGFSNTLLNGLGGLKTQLGRLDIGDEGGLNAFEDAMQELIQKKRGFSSDILKQVGWDPKISSSFKALRTGFGDLRSRREAELGRVANFEKGLLNRSDSIYEKLSGATIKDADLLDSLGQQLDQSMRNANRFQSDVEYDLSDEMAEYRELQSRLGTLKSRRQKELDRVEQSRSGFSSQARDLQRMLTGASVYDAGIIDQYDDMFGDLRNDLTGFKSELTDDLGVDLSGVEEALTGLRSRREEAINPFFEKLSGTASGIGGLELHNEEQRGTIEAELRQLMADSNKYRGGRADELRTSAQDYLKQIEGQRGQYATRKGEINTQAEDLLKQAREGRYISKDDVAARQAEAEQLRALVDQFGVGEAQDEISGLQEFLQGQTNRIEQDAANVTRAQTTGQSFARKMLDGNGFLNKMRQRSLSDDEVMALMRQLEQEDPALRRQLGSAFSRNLGI